MRAHLLAPRPLAVLALVAAVVTILAPFGTDQALSLPMRIAFWGAIVFGTYAVGLACHMLLQPRCAAFPAFARMAVIATATGLATGAAVDLVTGLIFGWPETLRDAMGDWTILFVIGAAISLAIQIGAASDPAAPPAPEHAPPAAPPLLDRLPLDKRGALLALSVEDHYVRVRTERGEDMLLMRLSDAIRETAPTPGLQVHRSHWVALDAVTTARRTGDRAILTLRDGADIPASRSHIKALKDAGLLPG